MAATKYQLLYRYVNESTNTRITNSMDNVYTKVEDFVTVEHKLEAVNITDRIEGEAEREEMIIFGNSSENPKTDMLFAFDGTKKVKHKRFIPTTTGYVIRDWKRLNRGMIGNQGDFTKDYTTIGGPSPELGGTVVCKNQAIFNKYFPGPLSPITNNELGDKVSKLNADEKFSKYYSPAKAMEIITNATPFALSTMSYQEHIVAPAHVARYNSEYKAYLPNVIIGKDVYINPNTITVQWGNRYNNTTKVKNYVDNPDDLPYIAAKLEIRPDQIATMPVPGHYEDSPTYPYLIKDTYKRIELDPWFVNSTYSSLEAALEKAKTLVNLIGFDNIRLIKIVPFDHFVRIE